MSVSYSDVTRVYRCQAGVDWSQCISGDQVKYKLPKFLPLLPPPPPPPPRPCSRNNSEQSIAAGAAWPGGWCNQHLTPVSEPTMYQQFFKRIFKYFFNCLSVCCVCLTFGWTKNKACHWLHVSCQVYMVGNYLIMARKYFNLFLCNCFSCDIAVEQEQADRVGGIYDMDVEM